jgi:hypothetical protein
MADAAVLRELRRGESVRAGAPRARRDGLKSSIVAPTAMKPENAGLGLSAAQRINAMSESANERYQPDDAILNFEVTDDALERAGGTDKAIAANPTVPSAIICVPFMPENRGEIAAGVRRD